MKYRFIYAISMFVCCTNLCGQVNLVPNYSLDTFSACPNNSSQISYASPWGDANGGSTDYFNSCSSVLPVPFFNYNYSHNSHSGSGMAGAWMYQVNGNYREYLQVQLIDTLEAGVSYWIEFYVLLSHGMGYGVNNVGAYLSSNAIQQPGAGVVISTVTPQIQLPGNPVILDTMQWTRISACYQAIGGERFVTIGNFYDDVNTDTASAMGNYQGSYYFIDDIGITKVDTLDIADENQFPFTINIFPNPTSDFVTIEYILTGYARATFELVDVSGRVIFNSSLNVSQTQQKIVLGEIASGTYVYRIYGDAELVNTDILIINR